MKPRGSMPRRRCGGGNGMLPEADRPGTRKEPRELRAPHGVSVTAHDSAGGDYVVFLEVGDHGLRHMSADRDRGGSVRSIFHDYHFHGPWLGLAAVLGIRARGSPRRLDRAECGGAGHELPHFSSHAWRQARPFRRRTPSASVSQWRGRHRLCWSTDEENRCATLGQVHRLDAHSASRSRAAGQTAPRGTWQLSREQGDRIAQSPCCSKLTAAEWAARPLNVSAICGICAVITTSCH